MSRQTYYNLRSIIKTKLSGLNDDNGKSLFVDVLDYGEGQFTGYPSAVVLVSVGEGEAKDTARMKEYLSSELTFIRSILKAERQKKKQQIQ